MAAGDSFTNVDPAAMDDHRFTYDATVESVYDGDTITLTIDLGFGLKREGHKVRLYGIDAPEVRGESRPEGIRTRNWLRSRLPVGAEIIVKSHRDRTGKYGRWLATIYRDGVNLNLQMVELGLAEARDYGDRGGALRARSRANASNSATTKPEKKKKLT